MVLVLVAFDAEKKVEASEMLQALSLLQRIMTPEDFVKYQVLVAPKTKTGKTREQELADRVKSLQRLRTQETTHRGEIDKLELDLKRHRDMLQGVLSRIRVESEECDELHAQVAKEQAPPGTCETIPPTQSDSQPDEMYLSTVEEESGDESMLMGGSTGAEDGRDNGIWERRRNAIIKNKRMVKLKDKDKMRSKPCKTIIIEEEKPSAPPDSGKQLAEVIARLSQDEIGVVLSHLPTIFGSIFWGLYCKVWVAFVPGKFLKTLKSEVARSFSVVNSSCIAEPLRCDPSRGQRRVLQGAVPPRCDFRCDQRGEQCSSFSTALLRSTAPSAALWVPLDLCGSRSLGVLRAFLVLRVALWLLLVREVRLRVLQRLLAPPRAQRRRFEAVRVRVFALCSVNEVLHFRVLCRGVWAVRAQAVAWCLLAVVLVLVVLSLPLRCLRPGRVVIRHSPRCLFVACLHLNVSRMCLTLSQVC